MNAKPELNLCLSDKTTLAGVERSAEGTRRARRCAARDAAASLGGMAAREVGDIALRAQAERGVVLEGVIWIPSQMKLL